MPYPELMVTPMRQELAQLGVAELRTPEDVDAFLSEQQGTAMLVFNSVCGCAAGSADGHIEPTADLPTTTKRTGLGRFRYRT